MNVFDPKNFTAGGFLDSQVCDILDIKATVFDYNGTVNPPANVIEIVWQRADGKQRTEVYGTGKAVAIDDGNGLSETVSKQSKSAPFFEALSRTKFPIKTLGTEGLKALKGQRFLLKNIGKGKDNFVPAEYIGLAEGSASEAQAVHEELKDLVGTLILSAVKDGVVKKAAVTQRIGENLKADPNKSAAISLAMSDTFLATVPGVNFEKGIFSLIS